MMRINKKVEYALISLKYMRDKPPGELTTAREICDAIGVPFDATSRSLQTLGRVGVLRSEQGPAGGYQIVRDLSRVSLKEIMEWILGPVSVVKCMEGSTCELFENCNLISPAQHLNRKLINLYEETSVAELLSPQNASRSLGQRATLGAEL